MNKKANLLQILYVCFYKKKDLYQNKPSSRWPTLIINSIAEKIKQLY